MLAESVINFTNVFNRGFLASLNIKILKYFSGFCRTLHFFILYASISRFKAAFIFVRTNIVDQSASETDFIQEI